MSENELWCPVVGLEGSYEVSDRGRVRSLPRITQDKNGRRVRYSGRVLKQFLLMARGGYACVSLCPGHGQSGKSYRVHRLVLEAFGGPRPAGVVVRHLNGDPADNRLENLAWGTSSDNVLDSVVHGTHSWASQTHCAKGHEFSGDNLVLGRYRNGRGGIRRVCRTCRNDHNREYMRRRRVKAGAS